MLQKKFQVCYIGFNVLIIISTKAATSLEKYVAAKYEQLSIPKREYHFTKKEEKVASTAKQDDGAFISAEIKEQLAPVFSKFESNIKLKYRLDEREISDEVRGFMSEFSNLSKNITCQKDDNLTSKALPSISIFSDNEKYMGVSFHGVPGGHEFNSFVVGLYNAAGPGQMIAQDDIDRIKAINKKISIDLAVTLSCTNCPELVMAVERIALLNDNVSLDIYNLPHYEELKSKHNIMSVPCMILNGEHVHFGKKNISEILDILGNI